MWKNHLLIALRRLWKNRTFAAINVGGLSLGIAVSLLLVLFVRSELAVNDVFEQPDRVYRIDARATGEAGGLPFLSPGPLGHLLEARRPEVDAATWYYGMNVTAGAVDQDRTTGAVDQGGTADAVDRSGTSSPRFFRHDGLLVDPSFLEVFDLPLQSGHEADPLAEPRSALLREDLARELFGTSEATGRTLTVRTWQRGEQTYEVTGVWEELPRNAATQFGGTDYRMLLTEAGTYDFAPEASWSNWENRFLLQYVRLEDGADPASLEAGMQDLLGRHAPSAVRSEFSFVLNPLTTLHLTDFDDRGWKRIGLLGGLAALILLIAGINFTNMATARSLDRAREIGVRKTLGAGRGQLIRQQFLETALLSGGAALLAVGWAAIGLRPFEYLVGIEFTVRHPLDLPTLGALLTLTALVTLGAGAYPAFVLSGFEPTAIFRDRLSLGWSASQIRRGLVVLQFACAVTLLGGVYVLHAQLQHLSERSYPFPADRILVIDSAPRDFSSTGYERIQSARRQIEASPAVASASVSWDVPEMGSGLGGTRIRLDRWPEDRGVQSGLYRVGPGFAETYRLSLVRGRFFRDPIENDSATVVLNTSAVEALELENPIGATIEQGGTRRTVIGVIEDFNRQNVRAGIGPTVLYPIQPGEWFRSMSVRLRPNVSGGREAVRTAWEAVLPGAPFQATFLDERIATGLESERQLRRMVGAGAALALVVALLGLFGLTGFTVQRRTREIGVRKVLGARAEQIAAVLSADVAKLVGLGFLLGAPVAYLLARRWLAEFAVRIDLTPLPFLGVGLIVLLCALAAISAHLLRAVRVDPARTLRVE